MSNYFHFNTKAIIVLSLILIYFVSFVNGVIFKKNYIQIKSFKDTTNNEKILFYIRNNGAGNYIRFISLVKRNEDINNNNNNTSSNHFCDTKSMERQRIMDLFEQLVQLQKNKHQHSTLHTDIKKQVIDSVSTFSSASVANDTQQSSSSPPIYNVMNMFSISKSLNDDMEKDVVWMNSSGLINDTITLANKNYIVKKTSRVYCFLNMENIDWMFSIKDRYKCDYQHEWLDHMLFGSSSASFVLEKEWLHQYFYGNDTVKYNINGTMNDDMIIIGGIIPLHSNHNNEMMTVNIKKQIMEKIENHMKKRISDIVEVTLKKIEQYNQNKSNDTTLVYQTNSSTQCHVLDQWLCHPSEWTPFSEEYNTQDYSIVSANLHRFVLFSDSTPSPQKNFYKWNHKKSEAWNHELFLDTIRLRNSNRSKCAIQKIRQHFGNLTRSSGGGDGGDGDSGGNSMDHHYWYINPSVIYGALSIQDNEIDGELLKSYEENEWSLIKRTQVLFGYGKIRISVPHLFEIIHPSIYGLVIMLHVGVLLMWLLFHRQQPLNSNGPIPLIQTILNLLKIIFLSYIYIMNYIAISDYYCYYNYIFYFTINVCFVMFIPWNMIRYLLVSFIHQRQIQVLSSYRKNDRIIQKRKWYYLYLKKMSHPINIISLFLLVFVLTCSMFLIVHFSINIMSILDILQVQNPEMINRRLIENDSMFSGIISEHYLKILHGVYHYYSNVGSNDKAAYEIYRLLFQCNIYSNTINSYIYIGIICLFSGISVLVFFFDVIINFKHWIIRRKCLEFVTKDKYLYRIQFHIIGMGVCLPCFIFCYLMTYVSVLFEYEVGSYVEIIMSFFIDIIYLFFQTLFILIMTILFFVVRKIKEKNRKYKNTIHKWCYCCCRLDDDDDPIEDGNGRDTLKNGGIFLSDILNMKYSDKPHEQKLYQMFYEFSASEWSTENIYFHEDCHELINILTQKKYKTGCLQLTLGELILKMKNFKMIYLSGKESALEVNLSNKCQYAFQDAYEELMTNYNSMLEKNANIQNKFIREIISLDQQQQLLSPSSSSLSKQISSNKLSSSQSSDHQIISSSTGSSLSSPLTTILMQSHNQDDFTLSMKKKSSLFVDQRNETGREYHLHNPIKKILSVDDNQKYREDDDDGRNNLGIMNTQSPKKKKKKNVMSTTALKKQKSMEITLNFSNFIEELKNAQDASCKNMTDTHSRFVFTKDYQYWLENKKISESFIDSIMSQKILNIQNLRVNNRVIGGTISTDTDDNKEKKAKEIRSIPSMNTLKSKSRTNNVSMEKTLSLPIVIELHNGDDIMTDNVLKDDKSTQINNNDVDEIIVPAVNPPIPTTFHQFTDETSAIASVPIEKVINESSIQNVIENTTTVTCGGGGVIEREELDGGLLLIEENNETPKICDSEIIELSDSSDDETLSMISSMTTSFRQSLDTTRVADINVTCPPNSPIVSYRNNDIINTNCPEFASDMKIPNEEIDVVIEF